jgi:hypothetical protein
VGTTLVAVQLCLSTIRYQASERPRHNPVWSAEGSIPGARPVRGSPSRPERKREARRSQEQGGVDCRDVLDGCKRKEKCNPILVALHPEFRRVRKGRVHRRGGRGRSDAAASIIADAQMSVFGHHSVGEGRLPGIACVRIQPRRLRRSHATSWKDRHRLLSCKPPEQHRQKR